MTATTSKDRRGELPTDLTVLAAVERAGRHSGVQRAPWFRITEHLGLPRGVPGLRAQVEELVQEGVLERSRRQGGSSAWGLTGKGRRRLARARRTGHAPALPEAPQHAVWRAAREYAIDHMDGLRANVAQTLTQAQAALAGGHAGYEVWVELSAMLRRRCGQLAWAIYCREAWAEPSDEHADLSLAQRRRELGLAGVDLDEPAA